MNYAGEGLDMPAKPRLIDFEVVSRAKTHTPELDVLKTPRLIIYDILSKSKTQKFALEGARHAS